MFLTHVDCLEILLCTAFWHKACYQDFSDLDLEW